MSVIPITTQHSEDKHRRCVAEIISRDIGLPLLYSERKLLIFGVSGGPYAVYTSTNTGHKHLHVQFHAPTSKVDA